MDLSYYVTYREGFLNQNGVCSQEMCTVVYYSSHLDTHTWTSATVWTTETSLGQNQSSVGWLEIYSEVLVPLRHTATHTHTHTHAHPHTSAHTQTHTHHPPHTPQYQRPSPQDNRHTLGGRSHG